MDEKMKEATLKVLVGTLRGEDEVKQIRTIAKEMEINRMDLHFEVRKANRDMNMLMEAQKLAKV